MLSAQQLMALNRISILGIFGFKLEVRPLDCCVGSPPNSRLSMVMSLAHYKKEDMTLHSSKDQSTQISSLTRDTEFKKSRKNYL